ncbi:MAG: aminotransferase class V-fold PLP-dependent enzyme [Verrucomicrobia bacterium]|nr:aminotransferase class V-fold PLP-dependent enzyme [Verrucomicrobiota bacterium]
MKRRDFLERMVKTSASLAVAGAWLGRPERVSAALADRATATPEALAADEDFWREISRDFAPAPDFINLEYGYFHAAALPTLEVELRAAREINRRNSFYKRVQMRPDQEAARTALAALAGVSPEEIAVTRNTTESLNIVIQGLDLAAGDEIIYGDQDYGSMEEALQQKARRQGVVLRKVAIPLDPKSDAEVVEAYMSAVTPRTRLLHVTHLINITGHVLPVRKICDAAHERGIEVVVDAAHSFAHIDYQISDLGCDYLGTSLHKWLCSPLGMGLLFVRRDKIAKVWPLFGDTRRAADDIRKLEKLGTRPESAHIGVLEAIRFHSAIGSSRKQARLRYLHDSWANEVRAMSRVRVLTPAAAARHGAVGNIAIDGVAPRALADYWMKEHTIFTVGIEHPVVRGVRVTPGVPTPRAHVERFVEAVAAAVRHFA